MRAPQVFDTVDELGQYLVLLLELMSTMIKTEKKFEIAILQYAGKKRERKSFKEKVAGSNIFSKMTFKLKESFN
jgi:hypothetical protein